MKVFFVSQLSITHDTALSEERGCQPVGTQSTLRKVRYWEFLMYNHVHSGAGPGIDVYGSRNLVKGLWND